MSKTINYILKNRILSGILGVLFFIGGVLSRGQFIDGNITISLIIPLLLMSLGFGFIFPSLFIKDDQNPMGMFVKAVLAPGAIVIAVLTLNKTGVNSPIIKAGALFLINIAFFNKEINKALKN